MSDLGSLIPALVLLPMAGFLLTAVIGRRLGKQAHWIPVLAILAVWVIAMGLCYQVLSGAAPLLPGSETSHGYVVEGFTWIPADNFTVNIGFVVDELTACLLIVVTTIGLLVHVYSIGYMSHDPGYWRFFAYLNLFMFSMLLLVLASNFLAVFVAWELVGLCSYLLIGFWFRKRTAALAAKKAFIVNRVGDVGFILGIMLIFVSLGTLDIREVIDRIGELDATTITIISLLLFAGAMGKSAQFPLHVWLPGRDGRPDPGVRPDPRGDDGQRRHLPGRPLQPDLRPRAVRAGGRRRDRHLHRDPGRVDRDDPDRHQAGAGVLHAQPARLHVRGVRRRRVDGGDLPPHDPRLLQGPAVPRFGLGHPRRPRGAGHAQDGRPVLEDPDHLRDDAHRLAGDRRHPAAGRLLLEGRDPGRVAQGAGSSGSGPSGSSSPA